MGYGRKGWFRTYLTMIGNSLEYARNSASNHDKWIARFFAQLFAVIWYIFVICVSIILPLALIAALIWYLVVTFI